LVPAEQPARTMLAIRTDHTNAPRSATGRRGSALAADSSAPIPMPSNLTFKKVQLKAKHQYTATLGGRADTAFDPHTLRSNTMTRFQPATTASKAIAQGGRAKCGNTMLLASMVANVPGYVRCTFECPVCEHSETAVLKFQ
jgi:hypothetical protein